MKIFNKEVRLGSLAGLVYNYRKLNKRYLELNSVYEAYGWEDGEGRKVMSRTGSIKRKQDLVNHQNVPINFKKNKSEEFPF